MVGAVLGTWAACGSGVAPEPEGDAADVWDAASAPDEANPWQPHCQQICTALQMVECPVKNSPEVCVQDCLDVLTGRCGTEAQQLHRCLVDHLKPAPWVCIPAVGVAIRSPECRVPETAFQMCVLGGRT